MAGVIAPTKTGAEVNRKLMVQEQTLSPLASGSNDVWNSTMLVPSILSQYIPFFSLPFFKFRAFKVCLDLQETFWTTFQLQQVWIYTDVQHRPMTVIFFSSHRPPWLWLSCFESDFCHFQRRVLTHKYPHRIIFIPDSSHFLFFNSNFLSKVM